MGCYDPTLVFRSDNRTIYRNWSMASDLIRQSAQIVFDCGKCLYCRRKNARELAIRCTLHASIYPTNCFLTLTYDETRSGYKNVLNYSDIQKFKKRLRKHAEQKTGQKLEIFNVHEYGKNGKKHWHLIVFNFDFSDKEIFSYKNGIPLYTSATLSNLWHYGFSTTGDVSEATAMYQAQYTQKDIKNGNANSTKKAKSNHSGLGKPYFLKHFRQILQLGYIPFHGEKTPIPRYFEKLAHKHYCHFYDQSYFFDNDQRKKHYTAFKLGQENIHIAELWKPYLELKQQHIKQKATEWENTVKTYLDTKKEPNFKLAGDNAIYDLQNKNKYEKF